MAEREFKAVRLAVVLAGGVARRMGGRDKGLLEVSGQRLVDRAVAALDGQIDRILISGRHDYGLALPVLTDAADGPKGPAAGLFSASRWMAAHAPDCPGFLTVPADAPFIPGDLFSRLSETGGPAVAADGDGPHPTFAYWPAATLETLWLALDFSGSVALRKIARMSGARTVEWPGSRVFLNVNSPADLAEAEARLAILSAPS